MKKRIHIVVKGNDEYARSVFTVIAIGNAAQFTHDGFIVRLGTQLTLAQVESLILYWEGDVEIR